MTELVKVLIDSKGIACHGRKVLVVYVVIEGRAKCIDGVADARVLRSRRGAMELKFCLWDEYGPPSGGVGKEGGRSPRKGWEKMS